MASDPLQIRPFQDGDTADVVALWQACGLVKNRNDPLKDIRRKSAVNREWFLVGRFGGAVVATCMAGYEGHRGWINYLAVHPGSQRRGFARAIMGKAEELLGAAGCPKVNLQVRTTNPDAVAFYERIGYAIDPVVSLGKRLEADV